MGNVKRTLDIPGRLLSLLFAVPLSIFAQAEPGKSDELLRTIASLDAALFDTYNHCQLEKFTDFFTKDVEFYHDQTGLTVGVEILAEQLTKNICGKTRRELVAGSLEVYPLHGYGAVQMGVHRFYPISQGSKPTGIAKFIHLWQKNDGTWKITRVISYDHKPISE